MRAVGGIAIAGALLYAGCSGAPAFPRAVHDTTSGIDLVLIPAGRFVMGSPPSVAGREPQELQHRVWLTRPFYLGTSEVTQAQWQRVMGANPSHFSGCGPSCPVERVAYDDVQAFLARLNAAGGPVFRLPTEAEWEYACRAGGEAPFGHRASLGAADANINGRYPYGAPVASESTGTRPAGSYPPNPWGLVDMSGNVWEWTADWHCPYPKRDVRDPMGGCQSAHRVIRGGSWKFDGNSARCSLRYTHRPQDRGFSLGFRVARAAE
jgi:formylglycine-generating enzyme required for sulfatase activity